MRPESRGLLRSPIDPLRGLRNPHPYDPEKPRKRYWNGNPGTLLQPRLVKVCVLDTYTEGKGIIRVVTEEEKLPKRHQALRRFLFSDSGTQWRAPPKRQRSQFQRCHWILHPQLPEIPRAKSKLPFTLTLCSVIGGSKID